MNWSYPLASSSWDEAEYNALQEVINSGQFTMSSRVKAYELDFAEYLGSKYCVMCSSGSAANLLMIASLFFRKENPLKRGDEVIVPAVSWSTTYSPLQQYGLKLKFVDVDLDTMNFDPKILAAAVTEKTKVIFAVNLLGNPNHFAEIQKLAKEKNLILLEDNCESMGALYEGRQAGTFGLMGTFSSFFSHHISTMEGGVITTDNEELHHILLCLRAHGWTRNLPEYNHVTGQKSLDAFEESFKFVLPGYNVRPLEMSGAIGIEQLKKINRFVKERRQNAKIFQDLFGNSPYFRIQKEIGQSSWFGFSMILNPNLKVQRSELAHHLANNGVDCRPIVAGNFAKNSVLKWFDYEIHEPLVNADRIDQHGLFIGNHHYELHRELEFVSKLTKQFFKENE